MKLCTPWNPSCIKPAQDQPTATRDHLQNIERNLKKRGPLELEKQRRGFDDAPMDSVEAATAAAAARYESHNHIVRGGEEGPKVQRDYILLSRRIEENALQWYPTIIGRRKLTTGKGCASRINRNFREIARWLSRHLRSDQGKPRQGSQYIA